MVISKSGTLYKTASLLSGGSPEHAPKTACDVFFCLFILSLFFALGIAACFLFGAIAWEYSVTKFFPDYYAKNGLISPLPWLVIPAIGAAAMSLVGGGICSIYRILSRTCGKIELKD